MVVKRGAGQEGLTVLEPGREDLEPTSNRPRNLWGHQGHLSSLQSLHPRSPYHGHGIRSFRVEAGLVLANPCPTTAHSPRQRCVLYGTCIRPRADAGSIAIGSTVTAWWQCGRWRPVPGGSPCPTCPQDRPLCVAPFVPSLWANAAFQGRPGWKVIVKSYREYLWAQSR